MEESAEIPASICRYFHPARVGLVLWCLAPHTKTLLEKANPAKAGDAKPRAFDWSPQSWQPVPETKQGQLTTDLSADPRSRATATPREISRREWESASWPPSEVEAPFDASGATVRNTPTPGGSLFVLLFLPISDDQARARRPFFALQVHDQACNT